MFAKQFSNCKIPNLILHNKQISFIGTNVLPCYRGWLLTLLSNTLDNVVLLPWTCWSSCYLSWIRDELHNGRIMREYSVDLPRRSPPILTLINFHPVVEFDVAIRKRSKTYCLLDPINISKKPVAYEKAAPFIAS